MGAIASEKPDFDIDEMTKWLTHHEQGYFIRDEGSPFDCKFMTDFVFHEIYDVESYVSDPIFFRIKRR